MHEENAEPVDKPASPKNGDDAAKKIQKQYDQL